MNVGDLVVLTESPFEERNIFGYQNGDLGLIKKIVYSDKRVFKTCLVILLKDFKEYHIPNTYMKKLEKKC